MLDNSLLKVGEAKTNGLYMGETPVDLREALPVGTVVGEYVVEAVLGYGGYSVVYRAHHAELGNTVALKEYLPGGSICPGRNDGLSEEHRLRPPLRRRKAPVSGGSQAHRSVQR